MTVSRAQVLAHRVRVQGLDRAQDSVVGLAIGDLGVQDTGSGGATAALAARVPLDAEASIPASWARVWSVRGAPHWHRGEDLWATARALWPADDADASARLVGTGTIFRRAGVAALDGLRVTALALREIVTAPMAKGEVSAAVTAAVPRSYSYDCRACRAFHLQDNLLRLAALPAGLQLLADTAPPVLAPVPDWPGVPDAQEGAGTVIHSYLRIHGPAAPAAVATYLQTTVSAVKAAWPAGLAEVRVDGASAWLPDDQVDGLREAPAPALTRLLPSCDPWLLARDRDLVVPDQALRKALWPVIGWPGAVLADGEVVATWRVKRTPKALDITITPFSPLAKRALADLEPEAMRLAALRGLPRARLLVA